ncbi:MAG: PepSY domain-containing protein [Rhizobiales bacterium]|nr:PepSY domain-containing protein [Hyphomicrobiales bacterium]
MRHVKEDGGCYEAYGTSPEGKRVEAYFHPVTLELMLVAQRGEVCSANNSECAV